jgi:RNA polymerase sigma factor (sigma-70 family)
MGEAKFKLNTLIQRQSNIRAALREIQKRRRVQEKADGHRLGAEIGAALLSDAEASESAVRRTYIEGAKGMTTEEYRDAYTAGFKTTQGFLQRRGADNDLAEEVAQAAWARGWERLSQLRDSRLVISWVAAIAVHMLCDDQRSRRRLCPLQADDALTSPSTINIAAIDVRRKLQACPGRQRQLLQRVYLDECSRRELEQDFGITRGALNSGLSRARRALRRKMTWPGIRQEMETRRDA